MSKGVTKKTNKMEPRKDDAEDPDNIPRPDPYDPFPVPQGWSTHDEREESTGCTNPWTRGAITGSTNRECGEDGNARVLSSILRWTQKKNRTVFLAHPGSLVVDHDWVPRLKRREERDSSRVTSGRGREDPVSFERVDQRDGD